MIANRTVIIVALLFAASGQQPGGLPVEPEQPADRVVKSLLKAHNRERRLKELEPLSLSLKLCAAARIQARDMAEHQFLGHTGTDGSAPGDRIRRVGYMAARAGENCAAGQETVGDVMKAWMKSPGHRANILASYTEMGAAWAQDENGAIYWCVDFGSPRFVARKRPEKPADFAAAAMKAINAERQRERMVMLIPDERLSRAAMSLCALMAARDSFEIEGDPKSRIDKIARAERELHVIAKAGIKDPEKAARALHAENAETLHGFRDVGIGYAVGKSGTPYWCAIYAWPPESEPEPTVE
jgi:uncharacterized protein YkwD